MKPIAKVNDLRKSSDLLVKMMKDLDLAIRIVDTMQEREYLAPSKRREIQERESRFKQERGAFAKEVLAEWLKHGPVKKCEEVALRFALMLNIPDERFVDTVDDLAHVYERRYHELTHRAIVKQKQRQEAAANALNSMFTKKRFPVEMAS